MFKCCCTQISSILNIFYSKMPNRVKNDVQWTDCNKKWDNVLSHFYFRSQPMYPLWVCICCCVCVCVAPSLKSCQRLFSGTCMLHALNLMAQWKNESGTAVFPNILMDYLTGQAPKEGCRDGDRKRRREGDRVRDRDGERETWQSKQRAPLGGPCAKYNGV